MAKKKVTRERGGYSVTSKGDAHKNRKHRVVSEEERLRRAAKAVRAEKARKHNQRKRRADGRSTPAELAFRKTHLDEKGKFKKQNPGKPKGAKDRVPEQRKVKASVRDIIEEVVRDNPKTVRNCVLRGLRSGPRHGHHYLKLSAEYLDGKPVDTINVNSQYKQDELEAAKRTLGKKLDKLFAVMLENQTNPPAAEPAPATPQPPKDDDDGDDQS